MLVSKCHEKKCRFLHVCKFLLPWSPSCPGQAAWKFLPALIPAPVTEGGVVETSPAAARWAVKDESHKAQTAPPAGRRAAFWGASTSRMALDPPSPFRRQLCYSHPTDEEIEAQRGEEVDCFTLLGMSRQRWNREISEGLLNLRNARGAPLVEQRCSVGSCPLP